MLYVIDVKKIDFQHCVNINNFVIIVILNTLHCYSGVKNDFSITEYNRRIASHQICLLPRLIHLNAPCRCAMTSRFDSESHRHLCLGNKLPFSIENGSTNSNLS